MVGDKAIGPRPTRTSRCCCCCWSNTRTSSFIAVVANRSQCDHSWLRAVIWMRCNRSWLCAGMRMKMWLQPIVCSDMGEMWSYLIIITDQNKYNGLTSVISVQWPWQLTAGQRMFIRWRRRRRTSCSRLLRAREDKGLSKRYIAYNEPPRERLTRTKSDTIPSPWVKTLETTFTFGLSRYAIPF